MPRHAASLIRAWAIALALVLCLATPSLAAQNRAALVIGNSAYKTAPLKNPANDARDMAAALRSLGFEVTLLIDASHQKMEAAVREFGLKLRQGGVGLFYYAGHGIQVAGENYLVPVDAVIQTESDVKFGCLDAGLVLGKMEDARNDLNIVILDACRNNPFARSFRSAEVGLAKMDAPTGSIIAYATAPGSVAADGAGKNGVYTEQLLRAMRTPGLPITDLFMRVRMGVVAETGRKQVPWEASSLTGYFYFNGEPAPGQAPPPMVVAAPAPAAAPAAPALDLKAEKKRLAEEAARLKRDKQELAEVQAIQAEKDRLETERQKLEQAKLLALGGRPQQKPGPAASGPAGSYGAQFAQLARAGLPDARASFEQAVQARPEDADARAGLAIALVFSGREAEARYQVQRLSESGAQTPGVRLAKGLLLGIDGNADAAYQFNRAQEDGADRALALLCQAAAADRRGALEAGQEAMAGYTALVPAAERGQFAQTLDRSLNLVKNMAGSFKWVMPPDHKGYEARLDITFTPAGKGLQATATGKFWTFSGDMSVQDVQITGKTLRFTLHVFKALFGSFDEASIYRFTCDLSGSLDDIPVVLVEWVPKRDGRFVPREDYAATRLERQK